MSIYSSINPMFPIVWPQEVEALPQVWGGSAAGADIVERSQARVEFRKSHEIPMNLHENCYSWGDVFESFMTWGMFDDVFGFSPNSVATVKILTVMVKAC